MRCLLVYCHPVPESFFAALRAAAAETLRGRGWDVRLVDLYADGFEPVLSAQERRLYDQGAPADPRLQPYIESLHWAEAILFVYPTWWYGLPAMLRGLARPRLGDRGRLSAVWRWGPSRARHPCQEDRHRHHMRSWLIGQPGRKNDPARVALALRAARPLSLPRPSRHGSLDAGKPGGVPGQGQPKAEAILMQFAEVVVLLSFRSSGMVFCSFHHSWHGRAGIPRRPMPYLKIKTCQPRRLRHSHLLSASQTARA